MHTTDHDDPRPYPRLSAAQREQVLREVAAYFAALDSLRPAGQAGRAPGTPEER